MKMVYILQFNLHLSFVQLMQLIRHLNWIWDEGDLESEIYPNTAWISIKISEILNQPQPVAHPGFFGGSGVARNFKRGGP